MLFVGGFSPSLSSTVRQFGFAFASAGLLLLLELTPPRFEELLLELDELVCAVAAAAVAIRAATTNGRGFITISPSDLIEEGRAV